MVRPSSSGSKQHLMTTVQSASRSWWTERSAALEYKRHQRLHLWSEWCLKTPLAPPRPACLVTACLQAPGLCNQQHAAVIRLGVWRAQHHFWLTSLGHPAAGGGNWVHCTHSEHSVVVQRPCAGSPWPAGCKHPVDLLRSAACLVDDPQLGSAGAAASPGKQSRSSKKLPDTHFQFFKADFAS